LDETEIGEYPENVKDLIGKESCNFLNSLLLRVFEDDFNIIP